MADVRLPGLEREVLGHIANGDAPRSKYAEHYGRFVSQAIGRLQHKGLATVGWERDPAGGYRRVYELTEAGREALATPASDQAAADEPDVEGRGT